MGNPAVLDVGPLSWVKGEIDLALDRADEALARHAASGDAAPVREARGHLHQVRGALTVVGLEGLTRFSEAIEQLVGALEKGGLAWSPAIGNLAGQALKETHRYLEEIVGGRPDQPLRLYATYRELILAGGQPEPSPAELFFPDLSQRPPRRAHEPDPPEPRALVTRLKAARLGYQRGLLKWLKHDAKGLTEMRNSVAVIEMTQTTPTARAFWWVTLALLDAARDGALADDTPVRRLGARIDTQIRRLQEGSATVSERLMREALHGVASATAAGEHVECVRAAYRLDELVPRETAFPSSPPVEEAGRRHAHQMAREGLRHLGTVEPVLDAYFRDPAQPLSLAGLARPLGELARALVALGEKRAGEVLREAVRDITRFAETAYVPRQADFENVAGKLSALELFLEKRQSLPADIDAILGPQPPLASPMPSTPSAEEELAQARQMTRTLIGALREKPADATLRQEVRQNLAALRQDAEQVADQTLEKQAGQALAAIDAGEGGEQIEAALAGPEEELPPSSPEAARLAGAESAEIDAELLAIFLAEAREILATVSAALPRLRSATADREALAILQRGFHTLKGSGYMVGLNDFGAAAWAVEKMLSDWLGRDQPASQGLLGMLDMAHGLFDDWVARLAAGGAPPREAAALIEQSELLRRNAARIVQPPLASEPEAAAEAVAPRRTSSLHLVPVASTGNDGEADARGAVLPNESYLAAARGHVARLQRALGNRDVPGPVLIRAAHDLAVASADAGIMPVRGLAQALEATLERYAATATVPADGSRMLFARAAGALEGMLGALAAGRAPATEMALTTKLHALTAAGTPAGAPRAEIDIRLLPSFLEESQDMLSGIASALRAWRHSPAGNGVPAPLRRLLHTLKSSAHMTGAVAIAELAHDMESRLEEAAASGTVAEDFLDRFDTAFDRVTTLVAELGEGTPAPAPSVRVRADLIDRLDDEATESIITRVRVEDEIRVLNDSLLDLDENIGRLSQQLRELELQAASHGAEGSPALDGETPLQALARRMAGSVDGVATAQLRLRAGLDRATVALAAQARANRELSRLVMDARRVAFATVAERLHRVVGRTAGEANLYARLEIHGGQMEMDRTVLERLTSPLEHLLRNAVIHGIEDAETRLAAGKPESGAITVTLEQTGNDILITVADDGRGLDLVAIRARAVAEALLPATDGDDEQALTQLMFRAGFSTAATLSAAAGRGIGLDVVQSEVQGLGGQIDVRSVAGGGTTFVIRLPLGSGDRGEGNTL